MGSLLKISDNLHAMKPTIVMTLVQIIVAAVNICYKLAENDGMSLSILVGYRFMFGASVMVPLAFFVERKKRPKLTWTIVIYGFLCGLLGGSLGQNLYLKSLALTSATFASAMTNLMPAMTFAIAVCFRLEKLGWNTVAGKAKAFGTLMGIIGAMLLTFYKGPVLNLWNTNINLLEITSTHHRELKGQMVQSGSNIVYGALLALASCVFYSLWLIVQAKALKEYPCPYTITAMMTFWASIQGVAFALCTERDWNKWHMGWDIRLLTVATAGILGSGLMFTVVTWCVRLRGPLFVSIFSPLMLVMVAIAGSLFLEEKLHLGMLMGAILIVGGLYVVLWGKGKELKKVAQLMPENDEDNVKHYFPVDITFTPPPQNGVGNCAGKEEKSDSRGGNGGGNEEKSECGGSEGLDGGIIYIP